MAISSYQSYEMGPALTCTVLQAGGKYGRVIQGSATPSQFINGKCLVFMSKLSARHNVVDKK